MKVGFIFESGPDGADKQVGECFARRLAEERNIAISCESVTLDNKPNLIANCGRAAKALLDDGCDKVIIVWDLYPAWRTHGARPCRKEDRDQIHKALAASSVSITRVHLVCIEEELESWLIADGKNIESLLSTSSHRCSRIGHQNRPDTVKNPKRTISEHFNRNKQRGYGKYVDRYHAILIAKGADLGRVRRSTTFARFETKLF